MSEEFGCVYRITNKVNSRMYINRNDICKLSTEGELETIYAPDGWQKGRLKRK